MISGDMITVQGAHGAFWNTLKGFHKFWKRVDIICPFVSEIKTPVLFNNVYFHPLSKHKLLSPLSVIRQGLKICREQHPDLIVIHAYGLQLLSWGGWLLAKRAGLPFIVEIFHIEGVPKTTGFLDYLQRFAAFTFLKIVHHEALAFRVMNASMASFLAQFGISTEKIKILQAVYLDKTVFHVLPHEKKQYDIIFVGRLVPNKGLDILLEMFEKLQTQRSNVRFLIVGRGPLEKNILAKGYKGIHHIHSLPSAEDLAIAYNQAKVAVCASYAEGGPRYIIEAMACGLPVVSTPVGLMPEVVRDYETGFLLQDWSSEEMAERVAELLLDRELYQKCSKQACVVAEQFDYNHSIEQYALTYQGLVTQ